MHIKKSSFVGTSRIKRGLGSVSLATALLISCLATINPLIADETIKIGFIDPLSGGGASIGEPGLKHFQFYADLLNAKGGLDGKRIEVIPFDNKGNPQETLVQAQKAADMGIRIVAQAVGSANAAALIDFVSRYGERNPGKEIIYLNYGAVDPSLTNEKCSFWHFRFDANSDMKVAALVNFMKDRPNVKKLYLINQDYNLGHSVRATARRLLNAKRPDIEIVGDELHPLLKINDFAPYVAKIKASGADAVLTANWGQDFALLLKAAADAGLEVDWFTLYGGLAGGPTAIKQTGLPDRVFAIAQGLPNDYPADGQKQVAEFRAKYSKTLNAPRVADALLMLGKALGDAKSDDSKSIAAGLEGMKSTAFIDRSEIVMGREDHQLLQTLYIGTIGPLQPGAKFDEENTGWGWKMMGKVDAKDTALPTTCKMDRPL